MPACSFFSHLSLLCNPSPLLPRYHSSSACKPSCSEPQRTLLSVELRILSFVNMLASMLPSFFKALPFFHFMPFFKPSPVFSYGFSRVCFLPFPHFPNGSLNFPWFFQVCHSFFPPCSVNGFCNIFLHFLQPFATPSSVSLLIPLQTVLLRTPTGTALR